MARPRDALAHIVGALRDSFEGDLTCVALKGSVLRDDHIPFWSDLDVHAFVRGTGDSLAPDWPRAIAFQRAIGKLDPAAYEVGYFQVTFVPHDRYPAAWPAPFPSSQEVLFGEPPRAEPSAAEHLDRARERLAGARAALAAIVRNIVDRTDAGLARPVRVLGTELAGQIVSAACLLSGDPERVVRSRRAPLVHVVGEALGNERELIVFYELAREWREVRAHPEQLRAMAAAGLAALERFDEAALG